MTTQNVAIETDPQRNISNVIRSVLSRSCRTQSELTAAKAELAVALGMDKVTLNAKLRDERRWTIEQVAVLSQYFNQSVTDLYEGRVAQNQRSFGEALSSERRSEVPLYVGRQPLLPGMLVAA